MATIQIAKVISTLPTTLDSNTLYAVRTGSGFDLYMTDLTGAIAYKINSSGGGNASYPNFVGNAGKVLAVNSTETDVEWIVYSGGGGSSFLDPSDLFDESDNTYFYFGWTSVNGTWLIQRQLKEDGTSLSCSTGYSNLTTAWTNRTTLIYY